MGQVSGSRKAAEMGIKREWEQSEYDHRQKKISKIFRWVYFFMYPTGCSLPHKIASVFLELSWLFVIIPSGLWQASTDKGVIWPLSQQRCLRLGASGLTAVHSA